MSQTTQTIFETLRPRPPVGLSARVLAAVELEAAQQIQFQVRVASGCVLFSLAVFAVSVIIAGRGLLASDFWQIIALLSSDLSLVWLYSEVFLLSLVETFPAASASLLLAPLFLMAVSFAYRSRYLNFSMKRGHFQLSESH